MLPANRHTHTQSLATDHSHTFTHLSTHLTDTHAGTASHTLTLRYMPLLHNYIHTHTMYSQEHGHVTFDHTGAYLNMETHVPTDPHVYLCPREQTPHRAAASPQDSWSGGGAPFTELCTHDLT